MHHFHRTARQTKCHRPQRTGTSPVQQLVSCGGNKTFVQYTFNCHDLLPIQRAFFPFEYQPESQHTKENHHRPESQHTDIVHRHRPWNEEGNFKVEQDKKNRNQVIAHVEFHARIFERFETAFVRRELLLIWIMRSQDAAQNLGHHTNSDTNQNEKKNGEIVFEIHDVSILAKRLANFAKILLTHTRNLACQ